MNWKILESENYKEWMQEYKINSLLAKYAASKEIDYSLYSMNDSPYHDYKLLNDAKKISDRIELAILKKEKVMIYGDYDCDGIMATSILVHAFEKRGLQVGFHIPNRFIDGYGLNITRVKQIAEKGYHLIITVDNGVRANEAVDLANELGIEVIVTDHHEPGIELVNAYATLHAMLSNNYPFKEISGGFLAYKLAKQILGRDDEYLLCLAGLSTISDMMPVWNENRSVIKETLNLMVKRRYETFELLLNDNQSYTTSNLGFQMVPKINSIGRLCDVLNPNQCVKYFKNSFSSSNEERTFKLKFASLANEMNKRRQGLTKEQYKNALNLVEEDKNSIFIPQIDFHEGIIGLISGRLTKEFSKPSFILSYDHKKELWKGSARSIQGIKLNEVFETTKSLLVNYGGHELAGGFSILDKDKEPLADYIEEICTSINSDLVYETSLEGTLIECSDLSIRNVKELSKLEPFGTNNEQPVFCIQNIVPSKVETLSKGEHLKLTFEYDRVKFQALYFSKGNLCSEIKNKDKVSIIGSLSINKFRNFETIQFILLDIA